MGRIFLGTAALPGSHPWMAAIYIGKSDFCAGTLVSSCWIVSAAHCFFRKYVADVKHFVSSRALQLTAAYRKERKH